MVHAMRAWFLTFIATFTMTSAARVVETAHAAIEQAQSFVLQKNRSEACAVLNRAIPASGAKHRPKLIESLQQISKVFLTDKGQKTFEAAQAMLWDSPDLALKEFNRALASEDGNVLILDNIARIQIIKQDCDGALNTIEKARLLNPFAGDSAVLELRALFCQGGFELLRQKGTALPALDKMQEALAQYVLAKEALQASEIQRAFEVLTKVTEDQPTFPEAFYALAKAGAELEKDPELAMQKYVSLCKAVTMRERKKFALEPRLCANLKEAEDELAKKAAKEN